jgi:hypothetical protein
MGRKGHKSAIDAFSRPLPLWRRSMQGGVQIHLMHASVLRRIAAMQGDAKAWAVAVMTKGLKAYE